MPKQFMVFAHHLHTTNVYLQMEIILFIMFGLKSILSSQIDRNISFHRKWTETYIY